MGDRPTTAMTSKEVMSKRKKLMVRENFLGCVENRDKLENSSLHPVDPQSTPKLDKREKLTDDIRQLGTDGEFDEKAQDVDKPPDSKNLPGEAEEKRKYEIQKVPLQGIQDTNGNLVLKLLSEYTGEGECSECLDATTPCQRINKAKESGQNVELPKLDHRKVQSLFIDDGTVFKSTTSSTSIMLEKSSSEESMAGDAPGRPKIEKSKRLEGLLGEMLRRTVVMHTDGKGSLKVETEHGVKKTEFKEEKEVKKRLFLRQYLLDENSDTTIKPAENIPAENETVNCDHCDRLKKKKQHKDELVCLKRSDPGYLLHSDRECHPIGDSGPMKATAMMNLKIANHKNHPSANTGKIYRPLVNMHETKLYPSMQSVISKKSVTPFPHAPFFKKSSARMLNTYLSLADSSGSHKEAASRPSRHNSSEYNTYLAHANDERSSSPNAYLTEANRKSKCRSKLKDRIRYDGSCTRSRDDYVQLENISHHPYLGYNYPNRSPNRRRKSGYDRHVTFDSELITHHDRGTKPSNSPKVRLPSSNIRQTPHSRAPVHQSNHQQYAKAHNPSLVHHQNRGINKSRGHLKESLQLANAHFGSATPHRSSAKRLRNQFALSRPRIEDSLLIRRARRPSMVSTTLKKNSSTFQRPIHSMKYPGVRRSTNNSHSRRRSRLVEHHRPMRKRHHLIADGPSPDAYGKIDVKDFIDFLSSISRNTIMSLTNKKKALNLYRNYLFGP